MGPSPSSVPTAMSERSGWQQTYLVFRVIASLWGNEDDSTKCRVFPCHGFPHVVEVLPDQVCLMLFNWVYSMPTGKLHT